MRYTVYYRGVVLSEGIDATDSVQAWKQHHKHYQRVQPGAEGTPVLIAESESMAEHVAAMEASKKPTPQLQDRFEVEHTTTPPRPPLDGRCWHFYVIYYTKEGGILKSGGYRKVSDCPAEQFEANGRHYTVRCDIEPPLFARILDATLV